MIHLDQFASQSVCTFEITSSWKDGQAGPRRSWPRFTKRCYWRLSGVRLLSWVQVQLGQNGSSEKCTYWSESMNMLIGMAPKMCHHTVTGTAGGRPDWLLKWHRVLGVTSCDSQLRDGIFAVVALVEFKFSPLWHSLCLQNVAPCSHRDNLVQIDCCWSDKLLCTVSQLQKHIQGVSKKR